MTTMSRLARTPALHRLLDAVAEGHVVHHSGNCGPWPTGWSWSEGGHMTNETVYDVDTLWHAQLVSFDIPANPCGNLAKLTFDGSARLASWNERYPKGDVA